MAEQHEGLLRCSAASGHAPGVKGGQLEEEPPLLAGSWRRRAAGGSAALLIGAVGAVAAWARPRGGSAVHTVQGFAQLDETPCERFESEYCLNHHNSKSFGLPNAATCLKACFEDSACTGGYFFDGDGTCYIFGVPGARDSHCNPPRQANHDVHRFDCKRGAPMVATLKEGELPPPTPAPPAHRPVSHPRPAPAAVEAPVASAEEPAQAVEAPVASAEEHAQVAMPAATGEQAGGAEQAGGGGGIGCAGVAEVIGLGQVSIASAKWNKPKEAAGGVEAYGGGIVKAMMKSRAYFANACDDLGDMSGIQYSNVKLLGRRFRYFVDLSHAECGCNAALYLTPMATNMDPGLCGDHYCDAGNICGVRCGEIDIQEGNKHAWFSTLHASGDPKGVGGGFGARRQEWNETVYGPGARCIDTNQPFQVTAAFPVSQEGQLVAVEVTLEQPDRPCTLTSRMDEYPRPGAQDGMAEMSEMLRGGVTPIVSYWGAGEDMSWIDGARDGIGPGCVDNAAQCGEFAKFWGFKLENISP